MTEPGISGSQYRVQATAVGRGRGSAGVHESRVQSEAGRLARSQLMCSLMMSGVRPSPTIRGGAPIGAISTESVMSARPNPASRAQGQRRGRRRPGRTKATAMSRSCSADEGRRGSELNPLCCHLVAALKAPAAVLIPNRGDMGGHGFVKGFCRALWITRGCPQMWWGHLWPHAWAGLLWSEEIWREGVGDGRDAGDGP